ncbi:MAG: Spx/MgsR family RNA polymerase-binding regulatory protein [Erysipelotrichaceae bacterium]|nr:Spx/MgsR family RNA polymerase-binding regulatory protein [Erysipelotrichaceae bacterium]
MIRIYTVPSCSSCRKVKKWFLDQNIPFVEKNILSKPISDNEIKDMLLLSDNGTDDIISKRSNLIKKDNIDVDSMKLKDLIAFIQNNPTILKRPIIVDDTKMVVGYNPDEISTFIPQARRLAAWSCKTECPRYDECDNHLDVKA